MYMLHQSQEPCKSRKVKSIVNKIACCQMCDSKLFRFSYENFTKTITAYRWIIEDG